MIEYVVGAALVGGIVSVVDQQNLFGNNPEKKWFWDMSRWTPVSTERLNQARMQQVRAAALRVEPKPSPKQELAKAEQGVHYATQIVDAVKRAHPELTTAKYQVTS